MALMELKRCAGPTWYNHDESCQCYAVTRRGRAISGEYVDKARNLDERFNGVNRAFAESGPILRKLLCCGRIQCMVFGYSGEVCADVLQPGGHAG